MSEKTQNNSKTDAMKTYNYADAVEVAKRYFKGDDLAATVWVSKYALKDSMGNLYEESPEQMHRRIADEIERIERRYPNPMTAAQVYDLLKEFRYLIPQGGPMTGIGNNLPDRVAVELFCDRTPPSGRLVRRHHPHRRRTGAADETPRRRRARPVAHPAHRQPGAEQRADLDGDRAVHGAIFELDARRWRRTDGAAR